MRVFFRGSRDSFGADDLHRKCNAWGRTLTVIKTTNGNEIAVQVVEPDSQDKVVGEEVKNPVVEAIPTVQATDEAILEAQANHQAEEIAAVERINTAEIIAENWHLAEETLWEEPIENASAINNTIEVASPKTPTVAKE